MSYLKYHVHSLITKVPECCLLLITFVITLHHWKLKRQISFKTYIIYTANSPWQQVDWKLWPQVVSWGECYLFCGLWYIHYSGSWECSDDWVKVGDLRRNLWDIFVMSWELGNWLSGHCFFSNVWCNDAYMQNRWSFTLIII